MNNTFWIENSIMYGVPKKYYEEYGVRKYGFHGASHRYVSKRVCEFLGVSPLGQRIIPEKWGWKVRGNSAIMQPSTGGEA